MCQDRQPMNVPDFPVSRQRNFFFLISIEIRGYDATTLCTALEYLL